MSLTNAQLTTLADFAGLKTTTYGDLLIGTQITSDKLVSVPYNHFKQKMGLENIRFDWLLTDKIYIAGGSTLNWIWNEKKNEDIDFFFATPDNARNFGLVIENWGFERMKDTKYATTYFNSEEGLIVQLVGAEDDGSRSTNRQKNDEFNGFIPFGTPEEILSRFDLEICKFLVDGENVHFFPKAVVDFISKRLVVKNKKYNTQQRLVKYNRKGFYIPLKEEVPADDYSHGHY
jgi:hypothetical protein